MTVALTQRLAAVAGLVRENRLTADVGTDHGYLPAFLVISGKTKTVTASDIGAGPLENAAKTVEKYGLGDNISLVLSDGLANIPQNTEEIIIAGMGGNLIADILENAGWIKNNNIHLVLQPMTHSQDVRKFLCENGFYIDKETACFEDKRVYIALSAYYSGEITKKSDFYYFFGELYRQTDAAAKAYVKKQYDYIMSRYNGLMKSGHEDEAEFYRRILQEKIKNPNV
ncbi:MAG: class I SAM-dependent methyltransferase [Clostridiales bacterium]|nr:class I SAM-dependent methyltransferase [Clostridiales bacterium]